MAEILGEQMMTQEWGSPEPPSAARKPASTAARVAARLIDTVVIFIILVLGVVACVRPLNAVVDDSVTTTPAIWIGPIMFVAGVGIIVHWLWAWSARDGHSPGRAVMGLQLVDLDDQPIGHKAVAIRFVVRTALEGFLPVVGTIINFVALARNDQGQAVHDKVVKSRVLEALGPEDLDDDVRASPAHHETRDGDDYEASDHTVDPGIEARWPGYKGDSLSDAQSAYSLPDIPDEADSDQPASTGLGAFVKSAHHDPEDSLRTTRLSEASRPEPKPAPRHIDVTDDAAVADGAGDSSSPADQDAPKPPSPQEPTGQQSSAVSDSKDSARQQPTAAETPATDQEPDAAAAKPHASAQWEGMPIEVVDDNDDIELVEVTADEPNVAHQHEPSQSLDETPADPKPRPTDAFPSANPASTQSSTEQQQRAERGDGSRLGAAEDNKPAGLGAAKKAVDGPEVARWGDPTARPRTQPEFPASPAWPLSADSDDTADKDDAASKGSDANASATADEASRTTSGGEDQFRDASAATSSEAEADADLPGTHASKADTPEPGTPADHKDSENAEAPAQDTGENKTIPAAAAQPVQNPFDADPLPSRGKQTFRKQDVSSGAVHTGSGPQLRRKRNAWTLIGQDSEQTIVIDTKVLLGRRPQTAGANLGDARAVPVYDQTLSVSKSHALLGIDDEGLWIVDWGSRNGTFIAPGGEAWEALQPQQPYRLLQGDLLRLGNVDFDVRKES